MCERDRERESEKKEKQKRREREMYIYICCGVNNWGQVWPFSKSITGPSLFF